MCRYIGISVSCDPCLKAFQCHRSVGIDSARRRLRSEAKSLPVGGERELKPLRSGISQPPQVEGGTSHGRGSDLNRHTVSLLTSRSEFCKLQSLSHFAKRDTRTSPGHAFAVCIQGRCPMIIATNTEQQHCNCHSSSTATETVKCTGDCGVVMIAHASTIKNHHSKTSFNHLSVL